MRQEAEMRTEHGTEQKDGTKKIAVWKLTAGILLAAGITVSGGCGSSGGESKAEQGNKSLSLCISESQYEECKAGIEKYKTAYPDVELNVETYSSSERPTRMKQLDTELMAGKGPDLLFMEVWGSNDAYKMMKSGVFAPLDSFMEQDKEWDGADYVQAVLGAGTFDGKQMVMPLDYYATIAVASKEGMEKAGIAWDGGMDILTFMQDAGRLYGQEDTVRVFADVGQLAPFPEMLTGQFLDYEKGSLAVDAGRLREACEAYKFIFPEDNGSGDYPSSGDFGFGERIGSGEAYFHIANNFKTFIGVSAAVAADAEPVFCPLTNDKGETLSKISQYVGIRANSGNQKNAWNMIKLLLGDEVQSAIADRGFYCPVRKSSLEGAVEQAVEEETAYGSQYVKMGILPQTYIDAYKKVLMHPQKCYYATDIYVRFMEEMTPFYEDEASYEECMKKFEEYIKVYLTE